MRTVLSATEQAAAPAQEGKPKHAALHPKPENKIGLPTEVVGVAGSSDLHSRCKLIARLESCNSAPSGAALAVSGFKCLRSNG